MKLSCNANLSCTVKLTQRVISPSIGGYSYIAGLIFGWLLAMPVVAGASKAAEPPGPIRVITNDWTSQIVLAHIAGTLFEQLGFTVQYAESTTREQWGALSRGAAHVQVEVWEGTMSDMFNRMLAQGKIIDAGDHDAKTREEWWYPSYVEARCPGLPDWQALNRCAKLFATEDSGNFGIYIAGPWEKPEAARIRALKMAFRVRQVNNSDELWVELKKASNENRPIVLFNWTPNWVEDRFEGKFVEFPAYDPACETDPGWGINPDYHYDCGNPKDGWLKKAVWSGMPEAWPCAYQTLRNLNFNNAMISGLAARVDVDGLGHQAAAEEWLQQHESLWQSWIPDHCRSDG